MAPGIIPGSHCAGRFRPYLKVMQTTETNASASRPAQEHFFARAWTALESIPKVGGVSRWARTRPLLTILIWGAFASTLGAALGLLPYIGGGLKWGIRIVSFGLVFGLGVRWAMQGTKTPLIKERVNALPGWGKALAGTGFAIVLMALVQTSAYTVRANFDRIATGTCFDAQITSMGAETETRRYGKTPLWSIVNVETGEALTIRTEDVVVPLGLRIDSADLSAQLNSKAGDGQTYRLCTVGRNISATASWLNPTKVFWRGERPYATRISDAPVG